MSTHKHIDKICVVGILLAIVIAVLFMNGEKLGIEAIVNEDAEGYEATEYFTSNDLNSAAMDYTDSVQITLSNDSAKVSGSGAYVWNNEVRIIRSGYYTVTGSTENYRIVVDAEDYSKVWIVLNGVDIVCQDDACLQIENAEKVFLVLPEGTENTLSSGAAYSEDALDAGHNAAVYARDDLTITGSGYLSINAAYKHGIKANDDLAVTGGNITISAQGDGIHANNSIRLRDAVITVDAQDEGMQADETDSFIYIESGQISVTSGDDGIKACGTITIDGGTLSIRAGDDGIHSDTVIYVNDGVIDIDECYEGLEAKIIEIAGGEITIFPEDDGINANGYAGSSFGMMGHGFAQTTAADTESQEEETYVAISGGRITIVNETARDADGIDSNGSVYISGGDIRVSLVNSGSNNAIDYGSENGGIAEISGGTVVAAGSYNMAESFDSSSTQASIMYNVMSGMDASTVVALTDENGNVLLSETVKCSFSSIIISMPELVVGNTYTLSFNDMEETITIEEASASYGDAQSSMFGGTMNFGGMSHGGKREDNGGMQGGMMPGQPPEWNQNTGDTESGTEGPTGSGEMPQGMMPGQPPEWNQNTGDTESGTEGPTGSGEMPQEMMPGQPPEWNQNTGDTESGTEGQIGSGEMPQGMMPGQPPEWNQNSGDTESVAEGQTESGSIQPSGGTPMGHAGNEASALYQTEAEADNEAVTAETTVSEGVKWTMLGLSAAVLVGGLLAVKFLKGKSVFS